MVWIKVVERGFRNVRYRLSPEVFAVQTEGEPLAYHVVDEKTWESIISLPDDVSLQTSDHHGAELKEMWLIWGSWIEICDLWKVPRPMEPVDYGMMDSADELQATALNCLYGFYRVAISCLRTGLELMTFTAYLQLEPGKSHFERWFKGKAPASFSNACDWLSGKNSHPDVTSLESNLMKRKKDTLFAKQTKNCQGGWVRRLYWQLSDFGHARQRHTTAHLWDGSNGPIYVTESFRTVARLYEETAAAMWLLAKLAHPATSLPHIMRDIFVGKKGQVPAVAKEAYKSLFI